MATKGSATVGIDIGSSLIKVVEAKMGKDGINITAIGIGPTPAGTIDNEIIVDPQALGQALKNLLAESGITCKRSVSSVAGQSSVVVRIIEVPKMTRQELSETMKWEVERHVPFAADEVMMDFEPIERPDAADDDQNMEVLLAVAQQEVINSHIEALFAAGLQPVAIDVEPLAVCRSLIDASMNGMGDETVALISIGASVTELGVYRSGQLAFPRTLPIAGDAITRAISENLHINEEEAERIKRERGVVMLDRVQSAPADFDSLPGMQSPQQDAQPVDHTIDLSNLGDSQPDMGSYIPGLGFLPADEPSAPPAPAATPAPDFDIDLPGIAPPAPKPLLDFDLSVDDDMPTAPKPGALDPSSDPVTESASQPMGIAENDIDLSQLSSLSGDDEHADFPAEQVFDAMSSALMDLIAEIRRSMEYYSSRFQGQPDKILLCGGTAKLKDLDKLIANELGVPVVLANPLHNVTVFSRHLTEGYLDEVASVLPVSVGLAIRDMIGE